VSVTALSSASTKQQTPLGSVSLVGAGPGDADLLTVKALRNIEQADYIVYDRLVSAEICQLFPAHTPTQYVGKAKNNHSMNQDQINRLLIEKAKQGLNVCRLKGGDAFVFGRGAEEMLLLKEHGIKVDIVPGITAASACTSYAGIPLTHRGLAQGCTFVTAHGEKDLNLDWPGLAHSGLTLVFYMGIAKAATIQEKLLAAGMAPSIEVAIIENGSTEQQRLICGELNQLAELVINENVSAPALIVVGKVVSLAEQLAWFKPQKNNDATALFESKIAESKQASR